MGGTKQYHTNSFEPLVKGVRESIDQDRSTRGLSSSQLNKIKIKEYFTLRRILQSLYCAYFCIPKAQSKISLPLTASFYSSSKYDYRVVKRIYEKLTQLNWINSEKGQEGKGYTRIWATGKLSLHFDTIGFQWFKQLLIPKEDLIILRDYESESSKKKIDVSLPENDSDVDLFRDSLFKYNQFLTKHCVALDLENEQLISLASEMAEKANETTRNSIWLIDFSRIQLTRIFARGSLKKGGRFYRGWWQSLPSKYRPHITIDGYKTCEVDYSGIAIYIMYAERNIQFPHDRDPYDIGLENWQGNNDPRRKLIKRFFNARINDETGRFNLPSTELEQLGISRCELLEKILEVHEPIADKLTTGAGLETQFIDSQIASKVMDLMVDSYIVVLPIHDSFIVRLGYENELKEAMLQAFKELTLKDGQVTTDYPRLPEHFNMTDEDFEQATIHFKKDLSAGIVSIEDIADSIIEQRSSIMDGYISSWEGWLSERVRYSRD